MCLHSTLAALHCCLVHVDNSLQLKMDLGALACLQHFVLTKCIFYLHFYVIYFLCRIVLYVLILEFFKNYVNKFRVLKNSSTRFSLRYLTVAAGDITVVRH